MKRFTRTIARALPSFPAVACLLVLTFTALTCPAGEKILLSPSPIVKAALFISRADGSGERPLTQAGSFDYDPAWSPQGDWIVFTSEQDGHPYLGSSDNLYRIHSDGTGLDRLTDDPAYDGQAAFSPDGKRIVFVSTRGRGTAALWLLDLATRKVKPLTSGRASDFRPAWSPDGQWIAFSSDRGSGHRAGKGRWELLQLLDIYRVRPDGTDLKRITTQPDFCGGPKWAPDGKSIIAYCMGAEETFTYRLSSGAAGETRLVRIDVVTGATTPVPAGPGVKISPFVLPSGEIAYVRLDKPAGVFYTSGTTGPVGQNLTPAWSANGAEVVYSRAVPVPNPDAPAKRWSPNSNYDLFFGWWSKLGAAGQCAYDPKGSRVAGILLIGVKNKRVDMELAILEGGKAPHVILEQNDAMVGPQWSADGSQIIVGVGGLTPFFPRSLVGQGETQLGLLNTDGSGFHFITSGPNNNAFGSFAPDGKHIVYRTEGPEGSGLRIMNLEDHSIAALTHEHDNFPAWSPRGDLISFTPKIADTFEVFTIRPDGTRLRQLTHTPGNDGHASWSPDGERLVFSSTRTGFKDEVLHTLGQAQPNAEVFVMRYDGTHVEQLTDDPWGDRVGVWIPHDTITATGVK